MSNLCLHETHTYSSNWHSVGFWEKCLCKIYAFDISFSQIHAHEYTQCTVDFWAIFFFVVVDVIFILLTCSGLSHAEKITHTLGYCDRHYCKCYIQNNSSTLVTIECLLVFVGLIFFLYKYSSMIEHNSSGSRSLSLIWNLSFTLFRRSLRLVSLKSDLVRWT